MKSVTVHYTGMCSGHGIWVICFCSIAVFFVVVVFPDIKGKKYS